MEVPINLCTHLTFLTLDIRVEEQMIFAALLLCASCLLMVNQKSVMVLYGQGHWRCFIKCICKTVGF